MVGTKTRSVVGTRWVPRGGLREGCGGSSEKVTTQVTHRDKRVKGKKRRVESSVDGTVVWESIQDQLKT